MNVLVIFPNQLFEKKYLPTIKNIFLLEKNPEQVAQL